MIVSALICFSVAVYCFTQGLVLAGLLSLAGIIPGPGLIPLIAASVLLLANDHAIIACLPLFVIIYNLWVLAVLKWQ